jgi:hypothetical protein
MVCIIDIMLVEILYFFVLTFLLGFSISNFVKLPENYWTKQFLRIGFGLATIPLLIIIMNVVHIPLNWYFLLIIAIIFAAISYWKFKPTLEKPNFTINKTNIYLALVILMAIILFAVYMKGAFTYPYLEDDDSWDHAVNAKYVSIHETYSHDFESGEHFKRTYLEPYPPAFPAFMGILHQFNDSINWTLKFFNVLLISLGLIFFYLFAERFSKNKDTALFATFILCVLPSFMSHFIWAQTLALILFFPAFYCLESVRENKRYMYIGAIIIASMLLTQPSAAAIFAVFAVVYLISKIVVARKIDVEARRIIFTGVASVVLSMIYWFTTWLKFGTELTLEGVGFFTGLFQNVNNLDTSGGVVYGLQDLIFAPLASKMDQPIGWGIVVFALVIFGLILLISNYKKLSKNAYLLTILIWFVIGMIGIQGNALPFKLFPHRFWAFLAIPVAFMCAESINYVKKLEKKDIKYILLAVILVGLLMTSAYPKYVVETSHWPAGGSWVSYEEINGFVDVANQLPKNTAVFDPCFDEERVIGLDLYAPPMDLDLERFRRALPQKSSDDIYAFAKLKDFDYVIISAMCIQPLGPDGANALLTEVAENSNFQPSWNNQEVFLFKLN